MNSILRFFYQIILAFIIGIVPSYSVAQTVEWSRAFGAAATSDSRVTLDVAGNVVVSGVTQFQQHGEVTKFDAAGNLLWSQDLGFSNDISVATDADANVLIANGDGAITRFKKTGQGAPLWTMTGPLTDALIGGGIDVDGQGSLLISGLSVPPPPAFEADVFVSKFDANGSLTWRKQIATPQQELAGGVSTDALGNVYVTGSTRGDLEGDKGGGDADFFIAKLDGAGVPQWTRQFGLFSDDYTRGVSVDDAGNVFVAGSTPDSLGGPNAGSTDALVLKLNALGDLQWIRQFGGVGPDDVGGIAADGHGNVFVAGVTSGTLDLPGGGQSGPFVAKLDGDGAFAWSMPLVSAGHGRIGIAADAQRRIAVVQGNIVTLLHDIPEPTAGTLCGTMAVALRAVRRRTRTSLSSGR